MFNYLERSERDMGDLLLTSLDIRNFRGFNHLQIARLGRVNLIVGKNNIGKSSLLEALQLYAHNGNPTLIWKILQARDEGKPYSRRNRILDRPTLENQLSELRHLFYGRKEIGSLITPIVIGPVDLLDNTLSISIGWYTRQVDEEGVSKFRLLQSDEYDLFENTTARFTIKNGKTSKSMTLKSEPLLTNFEIKADCITIAPDGLDRELIGAFWDRISLTDLEKDVVEAMRIIAPGIERVNVVGNIDSKDLSSIRSINDRDRATIPIVKVAEMNEPIALRSLGDGMHRVFGLALALVNAKDSILLIDEIENGLHYSVQSDIWRLVFQLAHRLNVQVFATTHSLDCIRAFQEAAQENTQEEGLLIRLQSKQDEIRAVIYEKEDLAIADREQIEVR